MPEETKRVLGSFCGNKEALGTTACPRVLKNSKYLSRTSFGVIALQRIVFTPASQPLFRAPRYLFLFHASPRGRHRVCRGRGRRVQKCLLATSSRRRRGTCPPCL